MDPRTVSLTQALAALCDLGVSTQTVLWPESAAWAEPAFRAVAAERADVELEMTQGGEGLLLLSRADLTTIATLYLRDSDDSSATKETK